MYIHVSEPLFDIIIQAQTAAVLTNGAYDITVGPVVKLWRKARKEKAFPDKDSLNVALQKTGYRYLHIDTIHQSIYLEKKGMLLDVRGINKKIVTKDALDLIRKNGFNKAMVKD